MKLKVVQPSMAQGKRLTPGDIVDVPEDVARPLIAYKKAVEYTEPPKAKAKSKK